MEQLKIYSRDRGRGARPRRDLPLAHALGPRPVPDGHQPRQVRGRPAEFPGTLYLIVGVTGPRARHPAVVHRRQRLRAGRVRGRRSDRPLVCPSCDAAHEPHERFCADCGVPLVHARRRPTTSESERAARPQGPPGYAEGPLVRVATARHQAEAEMIQACCWRRASRRSRAARAASTCRTSSPPARATSSSPPPGRGAAREILGDRRDDEPHSPPHRHPTWIRALAVTLSVLTLAGFASTSSCSPFT